MRVLTAEALDKIKTTNASIYAGTLFMDLINYRNCKRDDRRRIERRSYVREDIALLRSALRYNH